MENWYYRTRSFSLSATGIYKRSRIEFEAARLSSGRFYIVSINTVTVIAPLCQRSICTRTMLVFIMSELNVLSDLNSHSPFLLFCKMLTSSTGMGMQANAADSSLVLMMGSRSSRIDECRCRDVKVAQCCGLLCELVCRP